jgi:hypothetical protein
VSDAQCKCLNRFSRRKGTEPVVAWVVDTCGSGTLRPAKTKSVLVLLGSESRRKAHKNVGESIANAVEAETGLCEDSGWRTKRFRTSLWSGSFSSRGRARHISHITLVDVRLPPNLVPRREYGCKSIVMQISMLRFNRRHQRLVHDLPSC